MLSRVPCVPMLPSHVVFLARQGRTQQRHQRLDDPCLEDPRLVHSALDSFRAYIYTFEYMLYIILYVIWDYVRFGIVVRLIWSSRNGASMGTLFDWILNYNLLTTAIGSLYVRLGLKGSELPTKEACI